jgi:hypothetical protein
MSLLVWISDADLKRWRCRGKKAGSHRVVLDEL